MFCLLMVCTSVFLSIKTTYPRIPAQHPFFLLCLYGSYSEVTEHPYSSDFYFILLTSLIKLIQRPKDVSLKYRIVKTQNLLNSLSLVKNVCLGDQANSLQIQPPPPHLGDTYRYLNYFELHDGYLCQVLRLSRLFLEDKSFCMDA